MPPCSVHNVIERTIFTLFLGVFLIWTSAYAEQQAGRVLDRNGESQGNCQIAFYVGSNQSPVYRATSNNDGNFYLNDPRHGTYNVVVRARTATIFGYGNHRRFRSASLDFDRYLVGVPIALDAIGRELLRTLRTLSAPYSQTRREPDSFPPA